MMSLIIIKNTATIGILLSLLHMQVKPYIPAIAKPKIAWVYSKHNHFTGLPIDFD